MAWRQTRYASVATTIVILAALASAALLTLVSCNPRHLRTEVFVTELSHAESIPRHGLFELSFRHNGVYNNNFFDVRLEVVFISPGGSRRRANGFFYTGDLWKVRFRPDEPGRWSYTYVMTGKESCITQGKGAFQCIPSKDEGGLRRHPENPYRWIFSDGKPYFPIGLQDCIYAQGAQPAVAAIDGERRSDKGRQVSLEDYFSIYGQAGFNLFRFSQRNCSYLLYDDLDTYREKECLATDDLLSLARKYGLRVMFGFFGYHGTYVPSASRPVRVLKRFTQKALGKKMEAIGTPDDQKTITKEKRFVDYCVARWGVYVDFWELLNERHASDEWSTLMADYVRSIDPDRKPVSTSWEKPFLQAIDINAPHWYESEHDLQSDLRVQQQAAKWKLAGKPVIVAEQGNSGMNWDPLSGLRMRIRAWTALFQEISFIFWNTSWSKAGMHEGRFTPGASSNIYLGPEERNYIRALQEFAAWLDAGVRMSPLELVPSGRVRAYGLISKTMAAAYLHHIQDHTTTLSGLTLRLPETIRPTASRNAEWIDPASGRIVARMPVSPGVATLEVPPFKVDLALRMNL
jgi:hypothetical protein